MCQNYESCRVKNRHSYCDNNQAYFFGPPYNMTTVGSGPDLAGGRPGAQPNYGQWRIYKWRTGGTEPEGRAPVGVWGRSPQKLTTYYENNCQKHRLLVGQSKNNEIEGFGVRPPVGGRPGARGPRSPLNQSISRQSINQSNKSKHSYKYYDTIGNIVAFL